MKNKDENTKKIYIQAVIGLVVLGALVYGIMWVLSGGLSNRKSVNNNIPLHSTKTAPAVVQHFLYNAGNIGNTKDTSYSAIDNIRNTFNQNLSTAYKNSVSDFASISPYVVNSTLTSENLATNGRQGIQGIYVLNKDSIAMGQIQKESNITAVDKYSSSHTEQAVSITVNFSNTLYSFFPTANDTSWDGSYNAGIVKSTFNNIKFTLVYEDGRWKIYSISQQDDIGSNFATYDSSFEKGDSGAKFVTSTKTVKIKKGGDLNEIFRN